MSVQMKPYVISQAAIDALTTRRDELLREVEQLDRLRAEVAALAHLPGELAQIEKQLEAMNLLFQSLLTEA